MSDPAISPSTQADVVALPAVDARGTSSSDLRVGGLVRMTTIDYPGELAAVVFCQGCPWRCRYCHNGHLLENSADTGIPWPAIVDFLASRRGLLDAVVFSGGEPTAQHSLLPAMAEVAELGFKVGLHTNGAYPDRIEKALPLLDWVALDIKAIASDYPALTGVAHSGERAWDSLQRLITAGIPLEVRTTVLPEWTPARLAALIAQVRAAGVENYRLQECDVDHALDPGLVPSFVPLQQRIEGVDLSSFRTFEIRGTRH